MPLSFSFVEVGALGQGCVPGGAHDKLLEFSVLDYLLDLSPKLKRIRGHVSVIVVILMKLAPILHRVIFL